MPVKLSSKASSLKLSDPRHSLGLMCLLVFAVVSLLLHASYLPGQIQFSNDGPLGRLMCQAHALPGVFTGAWMDLNSIGYREGGAVPNVTFGQRLILPPFIFAKFYAPIALMFLGVSAWWFFRRLGLGQVSCVLGGLAATLNSTFFSAACWGVASHVIMIGMTFLALGAMVGLAELPGWQRWIRVALAGLAVGMGVSEAADLGAIFSVLVASYVVYQAFCDRGARVRTVVTGASQVIVVALFAAFLAAQPIVALVSTQIQGIRGTSQDELTRDKRWNWATQFSLPKREALGLIVAGLFGYRMATPDGGAYWGAAGRDAAWDAYFAGGKQGQRPAGYLRFTGGGSYAGVLVVMLALWAGAQALRRTDSVFSLAQRYRIWFWLAAVLVSLLLAFGRYAPFYRLLYALPYASTVRNPTKFLHVLSFALIVLFAYGVDGVWRNYLRPAVAGNERGKKMTPTGWFAGTTSFDRRWVYGCLVLLGLSLVAWMVYSQARMSLEQYLEWVDFPGEKAQAIAAFSIQQVGWFVLFLGLAVGLIAWLFSGRLRGEKALWGGSALGLFVLVDLGSADQPWIMYWDYSRQYTSNSVVDILRQEPYEHRVACLPVIFQNPKLFNGPLPRDLFSSEELCRNLYQGEWAQHLFFFYNIQSLDVVQLPRVPQDLATFEKAFNPTNADQFALRIVRRWQLTNTRYLLGAAGYLGVLNQVLDPTQRRFQIVQKFVTIPKPGVIEPKLLSDLAIAPNDNGQFALFEFTGALPRVKLYNHWEVSTNENDTLRRLTDPSFNPEESVLVGGGVPSTQQVETNTSPGRVSFASYAPKDVRLSAETTTPSVLLLNDRFEPNWRVLVDGHPAALLRCNYIMRGVYLLPGAHSVEFRFEPPFRSLYISLAAVAVGLVLLGVVVGENLLRKKASPEPAGNSKARSPKPAAPAANAAPALVGKLGAKART